MDSDYIIMHPNDFGTYSSIQFEPFSIVNAVYRKDTLGIDRSPLSLALPSLPDDKTIAELIVHKPPVTYYDIIKTSPFEQKRFMEAIEDNVRVFLPQTIDLVYNMYSSICNSYANRIILPETVSMPEEANDKPFIERRVVGVPGNSVTGFYMTGPSGCGKSTSLKEAESFLPNLITHRTKIKNVPFKQIVYISVPCPHKSDFTQLYTDIGKAIDTTLHYPRPVFQNYLTGSKRITLGTLNSRLASLIDTFGIGMIIIDESQDLTFNSQFANSVRQFVNLSNSTKVAIGFVGTRFFDAYYHFDQDTLQTVRRTCKEINAAEYFENYELFRHIVKGICDDYQVFIPRVEASKDEKLVSFLYQLTHGNVGILSQIWRAMNIEFLDRDRDPETRIDVQFAIDVINSRLPHLIEASIVLDPNTEKRLESPFEAKIKAISDRYTKKDSNTFESTIQANNDEEVLITNKVRNLLLDLYKDMLPETKISDAVQQAFLYLKRKGRKVNEKNMKSEALKRIKDPNPVTSDDNQPITAYNISNPHSLDRNRLNGESIQSIIAK